GIATEQKHLSENIDTERPPALPSAFSQRQKNSHERGRQERGKDEQSTTGTDQQTRQAGAYGARPHTAEFLCSEHLWIDRDVSSLRDSVKVEVECKQRSGYSGGNRSEGN